MFGSTFYHQTTKRAVSIFGTLFNNISIRTVLDDGTVLQKEKVPISYGPKNLWLTRIRQDLKERDSNITATSLPRMAFEISSIAYDPTRQQNKLIRSKKTIVGASDNKKRNYQYTPAPYNIGFGLSIYANNITDALQIVEQILPYFQPEYSVSMKIVDDMDEVRDVPIILNSVSFEDNYEEGFDANSRVIQYNLDFTMKLYYFGPVVSGDVITKVVEREYIGDITSAGFTTETLDAAGLVKEVSFYEPAFEQTADTVTASDTITFLDPLNPLISVGDEVFGTGETTPPTVVSVGASSVTISTAVSLVSGTKLYFTGSVNPEDTYVISENVTFYDDGTDSIYSEDKQSDL